MYQGISVAVMTSIADRLHGDVRISTAPPDLYEEIECFFDQLAHEIDTGADHVT